MSVIEVFAVTSQESHDAVSAAIRMIERNKLHPEQAITPPGHSNMEWKGYVVGGFWIFERAIPHEVRPWRAFEDATPFDKDGNPDPVWASGAESFHANSHYLVFKRMLKSLTEGEPDAMHLSMRTVENDARHDWREMQRVKNALAGKHWEAIELYPDVDRVVDTANQYHLWCFPYRLPFGFNESLVADTGNVEQIGGAQRALSTEDAAATGNATAEELTKRAAAARKEIAK